MGAAPPPWAPALQLYPSRQPLRAPERTATRAGASSSAWKQPVRSVFASRRTLCVTRTPSAVTEHATRALASPRRGRSPRRPKRMGGCRVLHARVRLASGEDAAHPSSTAPRRALASHRQPAVAVCGARRCAGSGASVASGTRTATRAARLRLTLHTDTPVKPKATASCHGAAGCCSSALRLLPPRSPLPAPQSCEGRRPAASPEPRKRLRGPPEPVGLWDVVLSSRPQTPVRSVSVRVKITGRKKTRGLQRQWAAQGPRKGGAGMDGSRCREAAPTLRSA